MRCSICDTKFDWTPGRNENVDDLCHSCAAVVQETVREYDYGDGDAFALTDDTVRGDLKRDL